MSTTDLDAATLARSLRRMAGDGSVEWVVEPIQSSVLRDVADMLDENAKLQEEIEAAKHDLQVFSMSSVQLDAENAKLRELLQRLLTEYRYMRVRPRRVYMQHEGRMRVIEEEMRELGIEVDE